MVEICSEVLHVLFGVTLGGLAVLWHFHKKYNDAQLRAYFLGHMPVEAKEVPDDPKVIRFDFRRKERMPTKWEGPFSLDERVCISIIPRNEAEVSNYNRICYLADIRSPVTLVDCALQHYVEYLENRSAGGQPLAAS